MTANTVAENQLMDYFDQHEHLWLFGYGSLIFKADFPYLERKPAAIRHWVRRFWQGSHDHRGTPENPGRVVTLIEEPSAICHGMAYRITPAEFAHLDHREKNGYLRVITDIYFENHEIEEGLIYIAHHHNPAFLGKASEREIALQIHNAKGPSGNNKDYLFELAHALRSLGKEDRHIFEIEQHLLDIANRGEGKA